MRTCRTALPHLCVLLAWLLSSCGYEDPVFELTTGFVQVTSTPPGAPIYWGESDTGLLTPATLNLVAEGPHVIRVRRAGYTADPESLVVDVARGRTALAAFTLSEIPGSLVVESTPDGAAVILDGADTGATTPATLAGLAVGDHVVRVSLAGYVAEPESLTVAVAAESLAHAAFTLTAQSPPATKVVLLEDFANVSCEPGCRELNAVLHDLTAEAGYGPDRLLVIKYATSWPAVSDPHYLANPADNDARLNFYMDYLVAAGYAIPLLLPDGGANLYQPDVTAQDLKAVIDPLLAREPGVAIRVQSESGGYTVTATVTLEAQADLDLTAYTLKAVLVQDPVEYETAPGTTGETVFHHVMRDCETVVSPVPALSAGTPLVRTVTLSRPDLQWPSADLHVIAYLQNDTTLAVLQAGSDIPVAGTAAPVRATPAAIPMAR